MLKLSASHKILIHRNSEQTIFPEWWILGNSLSPMIPLRMKIVLSTLQCWEHPEPRNSRNSRSGAIIIDRVKVGPLTGIEVFESAGASVEEVQVSHQRPEQVKSWVRISRGVDQHARQLIDS